MPRNTIQIRLKRISTSVHSAGLLEHEAGDDLEHAQRGGQASMAQAASITACLVMRSIRRKVSFTIGAAAEGSGMKTPESRRTSGVVADIGAGIT
jgi:hypothetical protein